MVNLSDKIRQFQSNLRTQSSAETGRFQSKATIIAISSQKGGVGKTTTSVNLALALANFHNQKTLLIDLDPQGHVEKSIAAEIPEGVDYLPLSSIFLNRKTNLLDGIIKTTISNLHITPGDKSLYDTEGMLTSRLGREFILNNSLKDIKSQYDIIIIDCPPNLGNLTINALCCADHVLIPCEMSVLGFEGVSDLIETVEQINQSLNHNLKILGVAFTRVDRRNHAINKLIIENISKMFKGKIFATQLMINTDLNKAQLYGRSIFDFAPTSTGAKNYKSLADEVFGKLFPKLKGKIRTVKAKYKANH